MRFDSKRRWIFVAVVSLSLLGLQPAARATVIDLSASQDASLLGGTDSTGGRNQSLADPGIFVGTDGQDNPKRGLVEFNLAPASSGIPAGSTITNVQLQMTVGQVAGSGGGGGSGSGATNTIGLFDETQAWGQPTNVAGSTNFGGTGHGGAAATNDATWDYAFSTATPWSTALGGNWTSGSTDLDDAETTTTNGAVVTWTSNAAVVADVQKWLDTPSTNFGWLLKNSDETDATDFNAFWSQQGATADGNQSLAPELIVTYTPAPEPNGILLLLVGLPMLVRRRSRKCDGIQVN
jgi:hypothetical protein